MPNPRNRLKLTGDTHLPDMGDDGAGEEDVLAYEPAGAEEGESSDIEALSSGSAYERGGRRYLDAARQQMRQRPVASLAAAFALGLLLARI